MTNQEIIKGINNAEWNGEGNPLYSYDQMLVAMDAARKDEAQWHPMEEAPKYELGKGMELEFLYIVRKNENGVIWYYIGYWHPIQKNWVNVEDLKIISNPLAWTHLPIYNPKNKDK